MTNVNQNKITIPADIWFDIKKEWLGLGDNWNAGFTDWCKGSPIVNLFYSDPCIKAYYDNINQRCLRENKSVHGPTLSLWWNKYAGLISPSYMIRDKFKLSERTLIGRLHVVYFYWDLQGHNGEYAQERARLKLKADREKRWKNTFSQSWFELRLCYIPFVEHNHDGPKGSLVIN